MHNDESNLQCKCDCAGADDKKSILHCVVSFRQYSAFFGEGKTACFFKHSDSSLLKM